jgi:hypothetical protein
MIVRELIDSQRELFSDLRGWWSRESLAIRLGVLAALTLGVIVRLVFIDQPMRQDEAVTVTEFVQLPLRGTISNYALPNNHIFHSVLVKVSIALFGNDPWAARIPAFIAGVLLIPATYAVGRIFYGSVVGVIAAGLAAASSALTLYSTNARGYTMIVFAMLVAFCLAAYLQSKRSLAAWGWIVIIAALGFWTNPSMLYPFGGVALWYLWETIARRPIRGDRIGALAIACTLGGIATGVLYVPVILVTGWRALFANEYITPATWATFFRAVPPFLSQLWVHWMSGVPLIVQIVLAAAAVAGIAGHHRLSTTRISPLAAAAVWSLLVLVAMHRLPFVRIWLYLLPLVYITASAGLVWLASLVMRGIAPVPAAATAAIVGIALAAPVIATRAPEQLNETGPFPSGERVAGLLARSLQPGDGITGMWRASGTVDYYLRRAGTQALFMNPRTLPKNRLFVIVDDERQETVASILEQRSIPADSLGSPTVVERLPGTTVYVVSRAGAGSE